MHEKVLQFLKRQHNELNQFHTEKMNLLTKRAAGIMWKCNNLWYLSRKTCTQLCILEKGIEKEVTRIDKNGEKITKNISCILWFIDSARFMASSLSNFVYNLSEEIHRIKCKYGHHW